MASGGDGRPRRAAPRSAPRDWDAAAYHRLSNPQVTWGLQVLERIALRGDEHALDGGCGSGRLTAELLQRLPAGFVVASDLSEAMTRATVATLAGERPPRQAVVCADLLRLPFRGAFDLVFSTATFHWIHDHRRLFASIATALRAEGRLEAQCGGGPNLRRVHERALALAATPGFQSYFEQWLEPWHFPAPDTAAARLREAGFADVQCWIVEAPTLFEDAAAYRQFLETVVMRPFLARLPTARLRGQFLDLLTEAAAREDGAFLLDYWRLNISASKTLRRRRSPSVPTSAST